MKSHKSHDRRDYEKAPQNSRLTFIMSRLGRKARPSEGLISKCVIIQFILDVICRLSTENTPVLPEPETKFLGVYLKIYIQVR
jgi:hypothetical protein